ncbi:MAG TPA: hypothetical protein P5114_13095 [Hyphomicrobiaceae bacterium]|nr:hypothetical protein [Hyphomicrobiaceae bacterium]
MSLNSMSLGRFMPAATGKSRLSVALAAFGERFIAAQHARANRLVWPYLAQVREADLKELGFNDAEIADIRKHRHLPVVTRL